MQKVLMIDDDKQVAGVLAMALEMMGHSVTVAHETSRIEEICIENAPDVVLLDLMMPGRSGLELLGPISEICPNAVISLVTGMVDPEVAHRSVQAGAWSVLYKPYSLKDLGELLNLSALIGESIRMEKDHTEDAEPVHRSWTGDQIWQASDLAQLLQSARGAGADLDTCHRKLLIVAAELLENARVHGAQKRVNRNYHFALDTDDTSLLLKVSDDGDGFDWRRTLTRIATVNASTRGLWLVKELADTLNYDESGNTAVVHIKKLSTSVEST